MCNEIGYSEVSYIEFEDRDTEGTSPSCKGTRHLHKNIFDEQTSCVGIRKTVILRETPLEIELRTHRAAKIASRGNNLNGKAEITVEWGGNDKPSVSGSVSGSVTDDKGNKAKVKVTVENNGSGKATVSAERDKKENR